MRSDRDDLHARGRAEVGRDLGPQAAERLRPGRRAGQHGCREPEPLDELVSPTRRSRTPTRPVVDAFVRSATFVPVSWKPMRSGTSSTESASVEASARLLGGELVDAC